MRFGTHCRKVVGFPQQYPHLHAGSRRGHLMVAQCKIVPQKNVQNNAVPIQVPKSLDQVDNGKILGFGENLAPDHPGYNDDAYKLRRVYISKIAREHEPGMPIPTIKYLPEEQQVWSKCVHDLRPLWEKYACKEFLEAEAYFQFSPSHVPQLEDLSSILKSRTGWCLRPTAGLLHPRDFLAGLYFQCFHSTQYLRHHSRPSYTPEPDLVHEALGHFPMLANPAFCEIAKEIGRASLGADDKMIWHLTRVYWYTVEFGVVKEDGEIKAFGAGILSSIGEMENLASGNAEIIDFDPFSKLPKMSYKDGYQRKYFVLESFQDGAAKLKEFCAHIQAFAAN